MLARTRLCFASLGLVFGLFAAPLQAATPLPAPFTLGKCVPGDSWLYVHVVTNPERAWLEARWSEIFAELKKSGVDQDLVKMIMSMISDSERASVQAGMDKVITLIQGVKWAELADKEFVFAERPSDSTIGFDYLFIVQGKDGSGEGNAKGLVAILKEAAAATKSTLNEGKVQDAETWEISNDVLTKVGLSITLFRAKDTIGIVTGKKTLEDVVGMLAGKSQTKPIITNARFQEALALVESPADSIGYSDWKMFYSSLRTMFKNIEKRANQNKPDAPPDADKAQVMKIFMSLLERADVLDYSVSAVSTKGMRTMRQDASRLQSEKKDSPLTKAILNRKPFDKFDQYIPAEATGFSLTALIDLEILYDIVLDFIAREIPDGTEAVSKWNGMLASVGFDPKADLFAWWSGEMASIEMPPAVVTPMGGSDGVLMIRVKNPEIARAKINAFVDMIKSRLQGEGQMLTIAPAKIEAEGFREIVHPSLAMFFKPVFGVQGDWLMVGSSSASIQKCLNVATGKAPSIMKNDRFAEEGLIPKGPVRCASFEDTSKTGQEIASGLGMVGMFSPMVIGGMPEKTPEDKKAKQMLQSAMGILVKLAPVVQKIDFYSSASSMGTYDGKLTLRTDSVTTYKKGKEGPATAESRKTGNRE